MRDPEAGFEIVPGLFKKGVCRTSTGHHKVHSQCIGCRAESPDMKIVQIGDARERAQP